MAFCNVEFRSRSLTRPVSFHLLWPNDIPPQFVRDNLHYRRPCKTLFLLHGYTAGSSEWLSCSPVMELSAKYNLAVVMPSGDISFYLDGKGTGMAYGQYIGQELPQYLKANFGLAAGPENAIIAGESMGGFGALHTALAYPDNFGAAIALSSALLIHEVAKMTPSTPCNGTADYDYYKTTFGDPAEVEAGPNNPETLVRQLKASGKALPRLFMACGAEDFLLERNRAFRDFLQKEDVPVSYHESPGVHNFVFWNQWIEPAVQWALGVKPE